IKTGDRGSAVFEYLQLSPIEGKRKKDSKVSISPKRNSSQLPHCAAISFQYTRIFKDQSEWRKPVNPMSKFTGAGPLALNAQTPIPVAALKKTFPY
ncbi:hypothetical protein KI387_041849, partial [Taxus chinensis]